MFNIKDLLKIAVDREGSDLHITVGTEPTVRVHGFLEKIGDIKLTPDHTFDMTRQVLSKVQFEEFARVGQYDLSYALPGVGRFRVNAFRQKGVCAMAIRTIGERIPTMDELFMPETLKDLVDYKRKGLILVTGATGTGKSTSLAAMMDRINERKSLHIVTLEDPIEYIHSHKRSIVNQRELGLDFFDFAEGLRASLRQDPDVILLGEMRDMETVKIALTAAETGHLVFSTLHTIDATMTVDRIIDVFPPEHQEQARVQLSNVLEAVLSQQLLPTVNGKRTAATEFLVATPAIRNFIREAKTYQIPSSIQTGMKYGMHSMNGSIRNLYKEGKISEDVMKSYLIEEEQK